MSSLRNGDGVATPQRHGPRRVSSTLPSSPAAAAVPRLPLESSIEEREPPTAFAVASEYLQKDLTAHDSTNESGTVVILHDACYGHRYSRPKTSRATLSTIVERPERIQAGIVGIATAYVRLGGRHAGGRAAPHPRREPYGRIPFRIQKTSRSVDLSSPIVTSVHGSKWMEELKSMCVSAEKKLASTGRELSRGDEGGKAASQQRKAKLHEGDLYLCPESLEAFQGALGGVCDGVDAIFERSGAGKSTTHAFVCIRPPGHHCSSEYPSGFCWLNNVHVGIAHAAQAHGLTHAAIIDFDLHHGDGSQSITWDHNARLAKLPKNAPASKRTSIGYFSIHDINSYPCEEGETEKVQNASLCIENAHGQSIWNVHLQPWKTDSDFWDLYQSRYMVLMEKARDFLRFHTRRIKNLQKEHQPKAAIFISAGFDASEWEGQGMQRHKVNVPTDFYARITQDIVSLAQEEETGAEGRVISVLEGGYSDRALISGVLSHLSGLCRESSAACEQRPQEEHGLGLEMVKRISKLEDIESDGGYNGSTILQARSEWWGPSALEAIESLAYPAPPTGPLHKPRIVSQPSFYSPTQSSAAKVVDTSKIHKLSLTDSSRAQSPPPPDVDWATAAHALSKLLIPTDRQISSMTAPELSDTRGKKDRPSSAVATAAAAPGKMQLRRKAKVPDYVEPNSDEEAILLSDISKTNRRRTIADVGRTASSKTVDDLKPAVQPRRRLSVASSTASISGDRKSSALPVPSTRRIVSSNKAGKPPAGTVEVKKARAAGGTSGYAKQSANKPRAETEQPPLPRVPSSYSNEQRMATQPKQQKKENAQPSPPDFNTEMDKLTSAVEKITIRVPAGQKYQELQKKVAEEAKRKAEMKSDSKRHINAPVSKPTVAAKKRTAVKKEHSVTPPSQLGTNVPAPPSENSTLASSERQTEEPRVRSVDTPMLDEEAVRTEPDETAHTTSQPDVQVPQSSSSSPPSAFDGSVLSSDSVPETQFIAYEPNKHGNAPSSMMGASALGDQPPLRWLPLNTDLGAIPSSPPPARKQKNTLPVFTSHGHIPFGAKDSNSDGAHEAQTPETPVTPTKSRE